MGSREVLFSLLGEKGHVNTSRRDPSTGWNPSKRWHLWQHNTPEGRGAETQSLGGGTGLGEKRNSTAEGMDAEAPCDGCCSSLSRQ